MSISNQFMTPMGGPASSSNARGSSSSSSRDASSQLMQYLPPHGSSSSSSSCLRRTPSSVILASGVSSPQRPVPPTTDQLVVVKKLQPQSNKYSTTGSSVDDEYMIICNHLKQGGQCLLLDGSGSGSSSSHDHLQLQGHDAAAGGHHHRRTTTTGAASDVDFQLPLAMGLSRSFPEEEEAMRELRRPFSPPPPPPMPIPVPMPMPMTVPVPVPVPVPPQENLGFFTLRVWVCSAVELDGEQMDQIARKMQRLTGFGSLSLENTIDPSLIAGVVISYGSSAAAAGTPHEDDDAHVIDLSVKGQLAELSARVESSEERRINNSTSASSSSSTWQLPTHAVAAEISWADHVMIPSLSSRGGRSSSPSSSL